MLIRNAETREIIAAAIPRGGREDMVTVAVMLEERDRGIGAAPQPQYFPRQPREQIAQRATSYAPSQEEMPENVIMMGSTQEAALQAAGSTGSDTEKLSNTALYEALYTLGKGLKKGEITEADVRKQFGLTGGNSLQMVNAAMKTLKEVAE